MIVCKFGGSSLADEGQIGKVKKIIESNADRKLIVVSAPGKRNSDDIKITDLLYACARTAADGGSIQKVFSRIRDRYLGISGSLAGELDEIEHNIAAGYGADYAASRGEYLSAKMLSVYFNAEFIDAAEVIRLTADGRVDPCSYELVKERTAGEGRYIIPGFYGTDPSGAVRTFSRGGSDITGAIAARAVYADLYENWTDVPGLLMADPRIFDNPPVVREITYREIRELACAGANVFHEEAIAPVKDAGIPINIRSTNDPERKGTLITPSRSAADVPVAGISGRKGYTAVRLEKFMLNRYDSFHSGVLKTLRGMNVEPGFILYGNDNVVFLIEEEKLKEIPDFREKLLSCSGAPDRVDLEPEIAVIGIVGEGLRAEYSNTGAVTAAVFSALGDHGINPQYTSFGGSDSMLLIGVPEQVFSEALETVYSVLKK